jgi:hypothetical protein
MSRGLPNLGKKKLRKIDRQLAGTLFDLCPPRICSRCGVNPVYQPEIPSMDLCEPCMCLRRLLCSLGSQKKNCHGQLQASRGNEFALRVATLDGAD